MFSRYCTVLYCTVLVLRCTVLVLRCTVLVLGCYIGGMCSVMSSVYCTVLYCTVLYCTVLCCRSLLVLTLAPSSLCGRYCQPYDSCWPSQDQISAFARSLSCGGSFATVDSPGEYVDNLWYSEVPDRITTYELATLRNKVGLSSLIVHGSKKIDTFFNLWIVSLKSSFSSNSNRSWRTSLTSW